MGLEESVNERIPFLREQINPHNNPLVNQTFQLQIEIPRNADREQLGNLIVRKKHQLQNSKSMYETDKLFTELEALEWLQRQVVKYL